MGSESIAHEAEGAKGALALTTATAAKTSVLK